MRTSEIEPGITGMPIGSGEIFIGEEGFSTPLTDSTPPSINFDEESSRSVSSIDASVKQLRRLMESTAGGLGRIEDVRTSPQMVNAVANCAKQITGLLRLKLDVIKEYRRGETT